MGSRLWPLLALLLPLTSCPSPDSYYRNDYSVRVWVRATDVPEDLTAIAGDKPWSGKPRDLSSDRDWGRSRDGGERRGWVLSSLSGGWTFNVGDGEDRLDYRAGAKRQPLFDGRWHMLAFTLDRGRELARLYYDGRPVAALGMEGMGSWRSTASPTEAVTLDLERSGLQVRGLTTSPRVWSRSQVEGFWGERSESTAVARVAPRRGLRVMTWNILHGGREDGAEGLRRTIEVIREEDPDVVCLQETYGAGPVIADALGFDLYQRSPSLVVLSRFPILEAQALSRPRRAAAITIEPWPGRRVTVVDVWLAHLPDIEESIERPGITAEALVRGERATRLIEVEDILRGLGEDEDGATPIILAGDFNCPSHRDFVERTRHRHRGLVVGWPVSRAVEAAGFVDALRRVRPDPDRDPACTWSPRWQGVFPHRIDFVYYRGDGLLPVGVETRSHHRERWPSDHAAVMVTFANPDDALVSMITR